MKQLAVIDVCLSSLSLVISVFIPSSVDAKYLKQLAADEDLIKELYAEIAPHQARATLKQVCNTLPALERLVDFIPFSQIVRRYPTHSDSGHLEIGT